MSSRQPLLAARGAGRKFGQTTALEPVELEVHGAEALALVGPNGAGKSTLLSLLAGALEPSTGHIERRSTSASFLNKSQTRLMRRECRTGSGRTPRPVR